MSTFVEFHVLQSFPVCNLNRDEVGSPKSCVIGGVTRARVSSQCWKRHVRCQLRDMGIELGLRTRHVADKLVTLLTERNPMVAQEAIVESVKKIVEAGKFDAMTFLTDSEYVVLASMVEEANFDPKLISPKTLEKFTKSLRKAGGGHCGLDVALFGRMVASVPTLNVEAACTFAHSYTTHAATSGIDYFTAVDDCENRAGYIDAQGFAAGTFYRYVGLNVNRLVENLGLSQDELQAAVKSFVEALYLAVPGGKQNVMAAQKFWDYAHVLVRTGQPVQASFEKPVSASASSGMLEPSIKRLEESLSRNEALTGTFYGKKAEFVFGGEESLSINAFADAVAESVRDLGK